MKRSIETNSTGERWYDKLNGEPRLSSRSVSKTPGPPLKKAKAVTPDDDVLSAANPSSEVRAVPFVLPSPAQQGDQISEDRCDEGEKSDNESSMLRSEIERLKSRIDKQSETIRKQSLLMNYSSNPYIPSHIKLYHLQLQRNEVSLENLEKDDVIEKLYFIAKEFVFGSKEVGSCVPQDLKKFIQRVAFDFIEETYKRAITISEFCRSMTVYKMSFACTVEEIKPRYNYLGPRLVFTRSVILGLRLPDGRHFDDLVADKVAEFAGEAFLPQAYLRESLSPYWNSDWVCPIVDDDSNDIDEEYECDSGGDDEDGEAESDDESEFSDADEDEWSEDDEDDEPVQWREVRRCPLCRK